MLTCPSDVDAVVSEATCPSDVEVDMSRRQSWHPSQTLMLTCPHVNTDISSRRWCWHALLTLRSTCPYVKVDIHPRRWCWRAHTSRLTLGPYVNVDMSFWRWCGHVLTDVSFRRRGWRTNMLKQVSIPKCLTWRAHTSGLTCTKRELRLCTYHPPLHTPTPNSYSITCLSVLSHETLSNVTFNLQ